MSTEAKTGKLNTSIVNPRWARPETIEDRVGDLVEGLGIMTIFTAPAKDGKAEKVIITPFDLWEARGLGQRNRERFIREVARYAKRARCVVIQSVSPVPASNRKT